MRWLNYQHLFYFWNIAKLGSVTEAAKYLKLAQPTISAQIKTFEEMLGDKLFRRDGKYLKLTDTGNIAFKYADQIFSLGQEFLDIIDGKIEHSIEQLKIGISDVVPKTLAYKLIEPAINSTKRANICCTEDKTEI
jgi:LysR family transcriptional activator of nhaA